MARKYIIVTGGVLSGIGKGVVSASIGRLMKESGIKVNSLKVDPYLNVDAGTMNPNQHGEVFVTDDGYEADLDLGHYERFLGIEMKRFNNMTAGQIYKTVIEKEREGKYLGGTVQMVPHVTQEIKNRIEAVEADVLLIEIGGTVGDIEGEIFLEAVRQLSTEKGRENFMFVHVTFVPYLRVTNEFKTKPTQQSVQLLRRIGIHPDMLVVRTEMEIDTESLEKVALFGGLDSKYVINLPDLGNIYEVPEGLYKMNVQKLIADKLSFDIKTDMKWNCPKSFRRDKIAIIGKYLGTDDAYKSIMESIFLCGVKKPELIDSERLEELDDEGVKALLSNYDGLIIPGGFGKRGIEGKIKALKYARVNDVPLLGICLGMQLMVIEYARNVKNLENANSREFDENTPYAVIDIMEEQKKIINMGGTMRLGSQRTELIRGSKLFELHNEDIIYERHRHRYEANSQDFSELFKMPGEEGEKLIISAKSDFVEAVELEDHPFYMGVQYHPEFKSKVGDPNPVFIGFVQAIEKLKNK
ncbi:CTP synthase [Oceanotoga sp. DSM 15011]|uniref:CTP synthase (glutamine hydrolyzing) n=1 Tax=Oceanotoga teriensis TaxID=515440 RepID=A0AA45C7L1_9BACT|nr:MULTISPECIES: CTP synthase [Oceanotoga]MDN5343201.1 synthase [Oceanotoga sp.]PWJ95468.1 CTP synthase [Oceanotoga teriensis]UYP01107.1 CTP synthase [Oceanotoga sp. DSM 15011]